MHITILSVGSKPSSDISNIIDTYTKRFPFQHTIAWRWLKPFNGDAQTSIARESEEILSNIPDKTRVILLDETGTQFTSPELSHHIFGTSQNIVLIIGGAHGVNEHVKSRADLIWSISKLVFPHQLVRAILAEQLYRAYSISIDHPYHHQ